MADGNAWPEQEAVLAWMRRHSVALTLEQQNALCEAVTRPRLEVQQAYDGVLREVEEQRDQAEARFVKVRGENDDLQEEIISLNKEIECRKLMHARLQQEYDAAKPYIKVPVERRTERGTFRKWVFGWFS